jgi:hypothetical protein
MDAKGWLRFRNGAIVELMETSVGVSFDDILEYGCVLIQQNSEFI